MSYTRVLGVRENGAVDEARTRDLNLGKVALYQLSYYRIKCWIGAGEETRTLTSLTPDPKSGASAIPPRPLDFGSAPRGGDPSETRTPDTLIKSQVLYHLS